MKLRFQNTGFTLIELMIVIAIVGVLTLIAYPAYQSHLIKANRAAAKSFLMDEAQQQQLFFNNARTYEYAVVIDLSSIAPPRVEDNYVVTFDPTTTSPVPEFFIQAVPRAGTRQIGDGTMSIDYTGEKLHAGEPW